MTKLQQHQITDTMRFDAVFGAMLTEMSGQPLSPFQEAIRTAMNANVPVSLEGLRNTIDAVFIEQQPAGLPESEPEHAAVIVTVGQLAGLMHKFGPADASDIESTIGKKLKLIELDGSIVAYEIGNPGEGAVRIFDHTGDAPQEPVAQDAAWPFPSGNRGQVH